MSSKFNIHRFIFSTLCLALSYAPIASASPHAEIKRQTVQPFLGKYCIECHGPKKQKGDVRFDNIEWVIKDNESAQQWQDILDMMNTGEMPPEDEKQPHDAVRTQITSILTKNLALARKNLAAKGGINPIRRMNKREYLNTMKHLFGLNVHESLIPDDIRGEHFDTSGDDQYMDGPLLDQYLEIGTQIVREGFRWSSKPYQKAETKRKEGEAYYSNRKKDRYDFSLPQAKQGYYIHAGRRDYRNIALALGKDPRASYKLRMRAGVYDDSHPTRQFLTYHKTSAIRAQRTPKLGVIKVTGTLQQPSTSEVIVKRTTLSSTTKAEVVFSEVLPNEITNPIRWFPIYLRMIGAQQHKPNIWVDWMELEGPFYDSKSNVFGDLIGTRGKNLGREQKARELIQAFTYEAFRRVTPDSEYINKLFSYYELRKKDGLDHQDAMSETLALVLISPGFLYLEETQTAGSTNSRLLESRAFVTRLAYFLWSAPPDQELYTLGESGEIQKPEVLKAQITRMLNDHRAESFYHGFMSQWVEVDRFEDITVDWKNNLTFNTGVRTSAAREPIEYFKTMVKENISVDRFIDSAFVMVDPVLAQYYELPGKHDFQGFKKIPISGKHPRGGIITQPAFLTMGSNGERSSPVIRGTMILEKLLNNPPPPPPPNVPEIESATDKPVSNRDLVKLHRNQKVCASCHDKIDPIGFGLENFNTVGLWQDKETVGDNDVSIDTSGILVSGVRFNDLKGLQLLLKSQEHKLAENLIETLTSYGIGRQIEFSDKESINTVLKLAKNQKFGMQDIIYQVANSKTFRSK